MKASAKTPVENPRLRLLEPDLSTLPLPLKDQANQQQQQVLDAYRAGADAIVYGAPGTGRTRLAVSLACQVLQDPGQRVLLLAPTRQRAAMLLDAISATDLVSDEARLRIKIMTPAAYAFDVLTRAAGDLNHGLPELLTGADHDALLQELLENYPQTWGISFPDSALELPHFRNELRDVMMRAEELGISPVQLRELAETYRRPQWLACANLLEAYHEVLELLATTAEDSPLRLDASYLPRQAADALRKNPALAETDHVIIDDAQDFTASALDLIAAVLPQAQIMLTTCPDIAVETFRGAQVEAAQQLAQSIDNLERTGQRMRRERVMYTLTQLMRGCRDADKAAGAMVAAAGMAGAVAGAAGAANGEAAGGAVGMTAARPAMTPVQRIAARLGLAGAPKEMRATSASNAEIAVLSAADEHREAKLIAQILRDMHHGENISYQRMAVVVRSSAGVENLAHLLYRQGLPVRLPSPKRPLKDEAVVADLFQIIKIGLGITPLNDQVLLQLLRGPYGDIDPHRINRIGRKLSGEQPFTQITRDIQTLVDASSTRANDWKELSASIETNDATAQPLQRIIDMIAAVNMAQRAQTGGGNLTELLWAGFAAAKIDLGWQKAVLQDGSSGPRSLLANQRLDTMTALFASAERYAQRRVGADITTYIEHIESLAFPEDSLARTGQLANRVDVLTPTQIAGKEYDLVVLAQIQEDVWPNTAIRSTLLGANDLVLLANTGRLPGNLGELRALQRSQVIQDEIRFAYCALTRASKYILVTAVDAPDNAPSALWKTLAKSVLAAGEATSEEAKALAEKGQALGWVNPQILSDDPGPAPDRVGLLASLRRSLSVGDGEAALLLRYLAEARVTGANPNEWYHQPPSVNEPILPPEKPAVLSPSALEGLIECPRRFFLQRAGAELPATNSQLFGTAAHAAAEKYPAGDAETLLEAFHELVPPPGEEATWAEKREYAVVEEKIRILAMHTSDTAREVVGVEVRFEGNLGDAELHGSIDRVEKIGESLLVVDIKTGNSAPTAEQVEENLQLASYQWALKHARMEADVPDLPVVGAELLHLFNKKPKLSKQGPLNDSEKEAWFNEQVQTAAAARRGPEIWAKRGDGCTYCPVRRGCPLQDTGQELGVQQ